jgi:hypothetical protein
MRALFDRDSATWGLGRRQALTLAAVPVIFVLALAALVPFFEVFAWLMAEDGVLEWLQFLLILATSLAYFALAARLWRRQRRWALLSLAAALGAFFVAGEEIAWGQRVFGWGTPAALEAVNYQQETTLHNIGNMHAVSIYAVMLGGLAAAVMPVLWAVFGDQRTRTPLRYLVVPPLCLVTAFIMPFGYRLSRLVLPIDASFPALAFPITKFSEATELCLYFGTAVFAWLTLQRLSQPEPGRWSFKQKGVPAKSGSPVGPGGHGV